MVTLLRFCFRKQPKNLNFQSLFTSKRYFAGYFQWKACTYLQKICSWARYSDAKLIKNISNFLVTLLRFCFRKQPKNLNFQSFFTSKRHFVGYFQWNACTYFQKIYNCTRYIDAKLTKNISNFLVALLRFWFRKEPKNINFQSFLPLKNLWWRLAMKRVHRLPEKMNFNQTTAFKTLQRKLNVFGQTTPFLL